MDKLFGEAEKPWVDLFKEKYKRNPNSYIELTGFALSVQEQNKQFKEFLSGVFGL